MQIRVYSNDGFQTYLTVNQNETSLAEREGEGGFPDSITLVVEKRVRKDSRGSQQITGFAYNWRMPVTALQTWFLKIYRYM